jgi:cytochrome c5
MARTFKHLSMISCAGLLLGWAAHAAAQESVKTVDNGVYSDVQATRGAAAYDGMCARCHRQDLGGADGPALREERFARNFAGKDLKTLYTKIATTMPRGAAASLADDVYLDILAHILRENGFPAGSEELKADALEGVQVLPGRPKPLPPVGDFSYVESVGCLVPGPDSTWLLANASEPTAVGVERSSNPPVNDIRNKALGTQSFHLLDALAYGPETHQGHKMYVRGLLIKLPHEQRMTISALEMVASNCH